MTLAATITIQMHKCGRNKTESKCWQGCKEIVPLCTVGGNIKWWRWERKMLHSPWEIVWRFLKKLKMEVSYVPAIPLGHIFQRIETQIHYSIIHNNEDVEQMWNIYKLNSISCLLKSQKG